MGWERDKPDWFTDNWKAKVPADWVPKEGKEEWKVARESVRKRSIVVETLGGGGGGGAPRREVSGKGRVYISD
jgi:hypothetical protein